MTEAQAAVCKDVCLRGTASCGSYVLVLLVYARLGAVNLLHVLLMVKMCCKAFASDLQRSTGTCSCHHTG